MTTITIGVVVATAMICNNFYCTSSEPIVQTQQGAVITYTINPSSL